MLTQDAIEFLDRCRFNDKSHAERTGLIKLAKELYPDPKLQENLNNMLKDLGIENVFRKEEEKHE